MLIYTKHNIKCFNSLIGVFIKNGKKAKAFSYVMYALNELHKNTMTSTLISLMQTLNNIIPILSFRKLGKRRVFYLPKVITVEKGVKIGTWGVNRSINWGWDFGF